jgi:hypothetical protein
MESAKQRLNLLIETMHKDYERHYADNARADATGIDSRYAKELETLGVNRQTARDYVQAVHAEELHRYNAWAAGDSTIQNLLAVIPGMRNPSTEAAIDGFNRQAAQDKDRASSLEVTMRQEITSSLSGTPGIPIEVPAGIPGSTGVVRTK